MEKFMQTDYVFQNVVSASIGIVTEESTNIKESTHWL